MEHTELPSKVRHGLRQVQTICSTIARFTRYRSQILGGPQMVLLVNLTEREKLPNIRE